MRILLLTQWFQPEPFFKGLPFAKALVARGHSVEVLTGFPNYPGGSLYSGYKIRLWQREVIEGVLISRVPLYPSHNRSGFMRILNYLSFGCASFLLGPWLVHKPDVIYVYNLITLGPAALLIRLISGAKVILDVQDLWPESVLNSGMMHHSVFTQIFNLICKTIYKSADWLAVLSPGFKQALIDRGVASNKIEVVYNWCDESVLKLTQRDENLAAQLNLHGKFVVLFAGSMGVMQGLDTVLEAARLCGESVPQAQFVFIGGGIDRPRLEVRAAELNLNNVQFVSPQLPQEMGRYFALSDALLVHLKDDPLFRITIPSKTQAYLHMGKPIIMAMQGDAADLVQQSRAGIVCPSGDPNKLAKVVEQLAMMPVSEREALGRAGAEYYAANLSTQAGVDHFEQRMQALVRGEH